MSYIQQVARIVVVILIMSFSFLVIKEIRKQKQVIDNLTKRIGNLTAVVDSLVRNPNYPLKWMGQYVITAYSSSPDETDDTPCITASGTKCRQGIIACNSIEFGKQIFIDSMGWFTCEDKVSERMSKRAGYSTIDIWMPTKKEAKKFGIQTRSVWTIK